MGRLPNEDWAKNMVFKFADVIVVSTNINALEFKYDFACIRINVKKNCSLSTTYIYIGEMTHRKQKK